VVDQNKEQEMTSKVLKKVMDGEPVLNTKKGVNKLMAEEQRARQKSKSTRGKKPRK
jgi:hypothetical protein